MTWSSESLPSTSLGVSKGHCAGIHWREDLQPLKKFIKKKSQYSLEIKVVEYTINYQQRS